MFKHNRTKRQAHKTITNKEEETQLIIRIAFRNLLDQINNSMHFPIQT